MGLFKKLVGDIAKTVGESLEEVSNEAKKSFQEAREEVRKNIQEAKLNQSNYDDDDDDDNWDYPLTKLSDDDDDIRIQLGTFKNGVLTINEGHTTLGEDALEGYKKIRKVVFPSTLREIDGCFFSEHGHEDYLEEVDFSKVKLLKEIPDCLFENCKRLQEINFPEGVEIIDSEVFDRCTNLRKITFPSTLKSLQSTTYKCKNIEELDLSKVHLLEEIPDNFIGENCKIETLVIPVGVKIVGDEFASSKSIREVYVPYTVEEIGTLNDDEYSPDVYIYTNKLTDIESLCANIKTLYVPEDLYVYYAELLKDVDDTEVRLRKMPADKLDFYGTPVPSLTEVDEEDNSAPQMPGQKGMGGAPQMPGMGATVPQVQYFIGINGQQYGPCDWNKLQQLVQQGQLTQQSYVWKNGMAQWEFAGNVAELAPLFQGTAPQMPGMPPTMPGM